MNIILSWKNIGTMYANNSNETSINNYDIFNLNFSKRLIFFNKKMTPFFSIQNLFKITTTTTLGLMRLVQDFMNLRQK